MDIAIDGRIDTRGGRGEVFLKNWNTGRFDKVDVYDIPTEEDRHTAYNINPRKYVDDDGRIIVRLRQSVPDRPNAEFRLLLNVVQVRVR